MKKIKDISNKNIANIIAKPYPKPKGKTYKETKIMIKGRKKPYYIRWSTEIDLKRGVDILSRSDSTHFNMEDLIVKRTVIKTRKSDLFDTGEL